MCILVFLFIFTSISYGNISFMAHRLLHDNKNFVQLCNVAYTYDQLNRLIKTDDFEQGYFDESFAYDAQGRIVAQRRDTSIAKNAGGEYAYYANTNRLKSVADGMGGTADDRITSDASNFVYDSEGNLIEDKSKKMRITYDWRGMPVEFVREIENGDSLKLMMMYDGNGKRISKTRLRKGTGSGEWPVEHVTHYTGIGTEIRTGNSGNGNETRVVVSLPQGLGRYGVEPAHYFDSMNTSFEWYLKNHLGSTMVVYRTTGTTAGPPMLQHAYDYRSYGEKIDLTVLTDKVTENYTGKELDDETELGYWGARYLDLMLGMWISVDPMRQFASPYLYAGNGVNPVNGVDGDGNVLFFAPGSSPEFKAEFARTIKYLNNGKSSAIIANLHKRKEVVYVREVSEVAGGEDGFIRKDEDLNAPTIDWDPYSALTFGDGLSQSPALGFLHEADHALGYLKDPDGFNARTLESDIEYDDQEEMRVIQGSETSAAKKLGEGVRHGHGGNSKTVDHSDER